MANLPTYAIYLIAFTMLFMLLAIIGLAVALYAAIKKKQILRLNFNNKEYIRQESTGVSTLCNNPYDDHDKNNGSTLTMNSGIIEINRVSDPETPTREDAIITYTKRPLRPIVPVIQRGQMDAICKEVLRRVQKSDSASFRDLNELLNGKSEDKSEAKPEVIIEAEKEKKNEMKDYLHHKTEPNTKTDTEKESQGKDKMEVETTPEMKTKTEIKNMNHKMLSEIKTELESVLNKDVKIEVDHVKDWSRSEGSESETEYDTVPSPVRYRHSGDTDDFDVDSIPVYDLLPRRSFDGKNRNVVQMDLESQYLLPLSADKPESGYVNCKNNRHSYNSS